MRRAAKVDENQREVVAALRRIGARVLHLHAVGAGCPDIAVLHGRVWTLLEIKDGNKPPSARKMTPAQRHWHMEFGPDAAFVVTSAEQAIEVVLGRSQGVLR